MIVHVKQEHAKDGSYLMLFLKDDEGYVHNITRADRLVVEPEVLVSVAGAEDNLLVPEPDSTH